MIGLQSRQGTNNRLLEKEGNIMKKTKLLKCKGSKYDIYVEGSYVSYIYFSFQFIVTWSIRHIFDYMLYLSGSQ